MEALQGRLIFAGLGMAFEKPPKIAENWAVKLGHASFRFRGQSISSGYGYFLTLLWIAANSSFAIGSVASGALISAVLAYIFAQKTECLAGTSVLSVAFQLLYCIQASSRSSYCAPILT